MPIKKRVGGSGSLGSYRRGAEDGFLPIKEQVHGRGRHFIEMKKKEIQKSSTPRDDVKAIAVYMSDYIQ